MKLLTHWVCVTDHDSQVDGLKQIARDSNERLAQHRAFAALHPENVGKADDRMFLAPVSSR